MCICTVRCYFDRQLRKFKDIANNIRRINKVYISGPKAFHGCHAVCTAMVEFQPLFRLLPQQVLFALTAYTNYRLFVLPISSFAYAGLSLGWSFCYLSSANTEIVQHFQEMVTLASLFLYSSRSSFRSSYLA